MKYSDPKLVEHLASQYALGTLSGRTRKRFEKLMAQRADIAQAAQRWQQHVNALHVMDAANQLALPPSDRVWTAIDKRTRPAQAREHSAAWWKPWFAPVQLLGGFAMGLAFAGGVLVFNPSLFTSTDTVALRSGERLPQSYVGLLTDAQGDGKVLVSSLRHGKTVVIKMIGAVAPPAQGSYVLWALPNNAPAFILGRLPGKGSSTVQMSDTSEVLLSKVSKLQVTLESSDTPTKPSANIVLQGNCAKLW